MSYSKTTWVNDETPINADNLNKIENQLETNTNNIDTKQARLVSGTNIRTINGSNLLGSGNLVIRDCVYEDWSQTLSCATGITRGSVSVPTKTGYTCVASVLRSSPSSYIIVTLGADGTIVAYNTSSTTYNYTIAGRFIYVRNT